MTVPDMDGKTRPEAGYPFSFDVFCSAVKRSIDPVTTAVGSYQPFDMHTPPGKSEIDAFNNHVASVADERVGTADAYWMQLVQIGT